MGENSVRWFRHVYRRSKHALARKRISIKKFFIDKENFIKREKIRVGSLEGGESTPNHKG